MSARRHRWLLLVGLVSCGEVSVNPQPAETASVPACSAGLADCDHDGVCETTLGTLESCGGCGDVCGGDHATPSCNQGSCALACADGWADCNGEAADGCEAHLATDAQSCGACGTSCGEWGDCHESTCVDVLASALGIDGIVATGASLYFSAMDLYGGQCGQVSSVPLSGGVTLPLVTGQSRPHHLHTNGTWLVWAEASTSAIYRMSLPAGPAELVHQPASGAPVVLDADADTVYFTVTSLEWWSGVELFATPIAGGPAMTLAAGLSGASDAKRRGDEIFVAEIGPELEQAVPGGTVLGHPEGLIRRISLPSLTSTVIAEHLDTPAALAVTDDALYWVEAGSMATYTPGGVSSSVNLGTLGRVVRAAHDGSAPLVLAQGLVQPRACAVDATHVYWSNRGTAGGATPDAVTYVSDGSVMRVALGGGVPETIVPAIDAADLFLTDDAVLFSSWNYGLVVKKQKP
jgi:hypothetical protein